MSSVRSDIRRMMFNNTDTFQLRLDTACLSMDPCNDTRETPHVGQYDLKSEEATMLLSLPSLNTTVYEHAMHL